ncbi:MbtH family NRPS accessory protein [Micromonospora sp. NPDC005413]|uniref:MbtH family protein n=1 Tax=Micromonospora sp. NPDC005413 TaxID=3154563 RepID=UPI0033B7CFF3
MFGENETDNEQTFGVVVNDEEQYSIWPQGRDLPAGWRQEGFTGTREACLEHVGEVWTDMRPLSLRQDMDRTGISG